MYHRGLIALRGDDANLQANQVTVRVASSTLAFDTSAVDRVDGQGPSAARGDFQKDFITKYMDPTEVYSRMDQLARTTGTSSRRSRCRTRRMATSARAWR